MYMYMYNLLYIYMYMYAIHVALMMCYCSCMYRELNLFEATPLAPPPHSIVMLWNNCQTMVKR